MPSCDDVGVEAVGAASDWKLPGPRPKVGDHRSVGILNPDGTTEQVPGVVSWVGDSVFRVKLLRTSSPA